MHYTTTCPRHDWASMEGKRLELLWRNHASLLAVIQLTWRPAAPSSTTVQIVYRGGHFQRNSRTFIPLCHSSLSRFNQPRKRRLIAGKTDKTDRSARRAAGVVIRGRPSLLTDWPLCGRWRLKSLTFIDRFPVKMTTTSSSSCISITLRPRSVLDDGCELMYAVRRQEGSEDRLNVLQICRVQRVNFLAPTSVVYSSLLRTAQAICMPAID